jgi:rubrerythrin
MSFDQTGLRELITESEDLQADALRDMKPVLADLTEIGNERRDRPIDLDHVRHVNTERRSILRKGGFGLGAFAGKGLLATGFGAALAALVASPVSAQEPVDVQILQTASSLETLAVATYTAALTLPFISGNATVKAFAETTMKQHADHNAAFQAQTKALGGTEQTEPNPKYNKVVEDAMPGLTDAMKVVELAMALEQVATQTYVNNMTLLDDAEVKKIMASVMGVEAQHLAVLRAVGALLGGAPELIKIPTEPAKLPAAAGSVAFPEPFEGTEMASPPEEGAVK